MEKFNFEDHSHRRLNILTGEWILVSPHRTKRPWNGKVEKPAVAEKPTYDPSCQLCPGNTRANGDVNPDYKETFVFQNDFSALLANTPEGSYNVDDLLVAQSERGICRVINFSPDHSLTLAEMSMEGLRKVVDLWADQYAELATNPWIKHVQIFENKGELMGNSNPHPHGQIWSQSSVPVEVQKKTDRQREYFQKTGRILLLDYLKIELEKKERIIAQNEHFVALVPFWATWPYEVMVLPRTHVRKVTELDDAQRDTFAAILKAVAVKYDNLFECSFPYSAGIHQSPVNDGRHEEWQMHFSFYPPLLRSSTIRKFMVGYEMFANPQRDITAEGAANTLRGLSNIHYKTLKK